MKTFLQYINESYAFLPTSDKDINASIFGKKAELINALKHVQKISGIADPLAIDFNFQNIIKVKSDLEGTVELADLKAEFGFKFAFGNGTRGNGGSNNRGTLFEKVLSADLEEYVKTRNVKGDYRYPGFIKDFAPYISTAKNIIIDGSVGELNQRRPLSFSGTQPLIGKLEDIGKTVTDVTVVADGKKHYLSLKLGGTVTFFNAGIKTFFPAKDFKAGKVTTNAGVAILKMLGIENERFVNVFNDYDKSNKKGAAKKNVNVTGLVDKKMLHTFLKSGVGYGFFLVHAKNAASNSINTFFVDKAFRDKATNPTSVIVQYPTGGTAKRVDILVETPNFSFKINIRNKSRDIFPSHIMCDYKIKH